MTYQKLEAAKDAVRKPSSDITGLVKRLRRYLEDEETPVVNPRRRDPRRDDD